MKRKPRVTAIAAIGKNRELGFKSGELVWRLSGDLRRFKELTVGNVVIMGRKTFDSIGKPLPGRMNIVVTRDEAYRAESAVVAHSIEEAVETANSAGVEKIFIGGGGELYKAGLPYTGQLELTHIDAEEPRADVFFPPYEQEFEEVWRSELQEEGAVRYHWITYKRK